ncbi:septum formation protein Maf [bacterium]|nr:septum formation protein Maf [bacterium]MBU1652188.1 septum formation protein Maf [bacterium]MBU1880493.1 septum formation protein Maf [bacterium]
MKEKGKATGIWELAGLSTPLILASNSPRRATILRSVGCPFTAVSPVDDDDEGAYDRWDDGKILIERAVLKAVGAAESYPGRIILAADTVIQYRDRLFGKPEHASTAKMMLSELSGKTHTVWTAIALLLYSTEKIKTALVSTQVTFRDLSSKEIDAYIQTGEPLDKAGGYGIQEIGGLWVKRLEGCYYNVVGLPISTFWELLVKTKGDL